MVGAALRDIDPNLQDILVSCPTWPNHHRQFEALGFTPKELPYYKNKSFDFDSYIAAIKSSDPGSPIIIHACAHNPTGCDPDRDQWKAIGAAVKEKGLFPIFDAAYLGFNSGSVDSDSWAIRYFVEVLALEVAVCVSFAKSMGLYGAF
jgi:aspartate aminotransferase